jgi:aspartate/methionine/tyrosine aminotransferase
MRQLVKNHKVAVLPGSTFGIEKGCYLRIAYGASDTSQAHEGIRRLVKGLQALLG